MTTEEMIAVLQAYKAGRQIQVKSPCHDWNDTNPVWNFSENEYRIKPDDPAKPKLKLIEILAIKDYVGDHLCAGGLRLDIWISHKNFVGFKFKDGLVQSSPVRMLHAHNTNGVTGVVRATHVVVEE